MRLRETIGAYRACFWNSQPVEDAGSMSPAGEAVLRDLARICYVNRTTASQSPHAMAVAEGRRQVWLHIQKQLSLTDAQVFRITQQLESEHG